jgi:hypothetical protein
VLLRNCCFCGSIVLAWSRYATINTGHNIMAEHFNSNMSIKPIHILDMSHFLKEYNGTPFRKVDLSSLSSKCKEPSVLDGLVGTNLSLFNTQNIIISTLLPDGWKQT